MENLGVYKELPFDLRFPTGDIMPTDVDEIFQMKRAGMNPSKPYNASRGEIYFENGRHIRLTMAKQGDCALVANIRAPKNQNTTKQELKNAIAAWLYKNPQITRICGERISGASAGVWLEYIRKDFI
jgi:hypothetical protein